MREWYDVVGKVSFVNCDPLYHGLSNKWEVLAAPPAWLTTHLLKNDCLVAPIPAADYALHQEELILLPEIGIASNGPVGSVLLFSDFPIEEIESVALPTDSSTSLKLLSFILDKKDCHPEYIEMGPDLDVMIERCDAALLIGDRALDEAVRHPNRVLMDLGSEWKNLTGLPMVFGVFAARRDSPIEALRVLQAELCRLGAKFKEDENHRQEVMRAISERSGFELPRIMAYFDEVTNILDSTFILGLEKFISEVCEVDGEIEWLSE